MKTFLLIFLLTGLIFSTVAQNSSIEELSATLKENAADFPKSKAFIKTDKDIYAPGEKVWFKAEIFNCLTEGPSNEIDLVVMIKAESGEIIADSKYIIINGIVSYYITIPSWAPEGNAYLIAHTPKALKVNEASLSAIKSITINNLKKNDYILTAKIDKKLYKPDDEIKLSLNLKAITPSGKKDKVIISMFDYYKEIFSQKTTVSVNKLNQFKFKIPTEIENGLYFIIQTTGKNSITQKLPVYTTKDKIKIEFYVEGGEMISNNIQRLVYRATDPFGKPASISGKVFDKLNNQAGRGKILKNGVGLLSLMPTLNQVYTFNVDSEYGKGQKFELPTVIPNGSAISLMKTEESSIRLAINNTGNIVGENLTLAAIAKGDIKFTYDFTAELKNNFNISTKELPIGVINLIVLNNNAHILSERLIYNIPNRDIDIDIQTHLKPSKTNGEVEVTINMNKFIKEFGPSWVDIKVVDVQNLYKTEEPLQYNFLEYPLYTSTPKTVLDIFMTNIELIANNYRYFSLSEILEGIDYIKKEKGKTLSGNVTDKNGDLIPNATVMVVSANNPSLMTTLSDKNGRFAFDKIRKEKNIVVKAINTSGKKSYRVKLDRNFDETLEELLLIESFKPKQFYDSNKTPAYFKLNEDLIKITGSETKDKKPKRISNSAQMFQSGASVLDVIKMIKPFTLVDNQIVFYGSTNSFNNQEGALIVIDGQKMGTSIDALDNVNPFEIVSVNISTSPIDIQQYTALNTVGIIEIRTDGTSINNSNENTEEETQQKPMTEFKQTDFPDKVWRYQSTIYWKPNTTVDENGLIKLNLKLSALKSDFVVKVDITSIDGITHQQSTTFSTVQ